MDIEDLKENEISLVAKKGWKKAAQVVVYIKAVAACD